MTHLAKREDESEAVLIISLSAVDGTEMTEIFSLIFTHMENTYLMEKQASEGCSFLQTIF